MVAKLLVLLVLNLLIRFAIIRWNAWLEKWKKKRIKINQFSICCLFHVTWYRNGKCKQRKSAVYMFWHFSLHELTCTYFNMGLHAISVTSDFWSNYKKTTAQCFHLCPRCLTGTQVQSNSYIYFAINRRTHLFLHVLFTKLRWVSWATKLKNTSLTIIKPLGLLWKLKAPESLLFIKSLRLFVNLFVKTNHILLRCLNSFGSFSLWY